MPTCKDEDIRQQEAIHDLTMRALSEVDLRWLMQEAVTTVANVLRTERCRILEWKTDRPYFLLAAGTGWDPGFLSHAKIPASPESPAGRALLSKAPIFVENYGAETRFTLPDIDQGSVSGFCLPIHGKNFPFGVLEVQSKESRTFDSREVWFAKSVTNLLGVTAGRQRAEGRTRQADKMSTLGQLASGIAHELNNPLTIILGFAQGALPQLSPTDPMYLPLASIEREADRCRKLIHNLLGFSREGNLGMILEDPVDVIENALTLVRTQAKVHSVKVERHFEKELPRVPMERTPIQQVVINLCSNAIDAMPEGGELTVALSKNASHLQIRIIDTGTGISPEIREKIFDPFFTTKEAGKGTGLGLSLVHDIVNRHHGSIKIQSAVHQGTTFIVSLPLKEVPATEESV
ncbi:MAG: ATP-binding protein [Elusimicrobiota bacterium]